MATRGSYVHNSGRIFVGIPKMLVLCNFLKILMASDKMNHKAYRTHTTLLRKSISKRNFSFLLFTKTIHWL